MVDKPEAVAQTAAQQIAAIIADPEAASMRALAIQFADEHSTLVIETQEEYDNAAVLLRQIKAHLTDLEKRRKAIVDPLNVAKNAVQAEFNPPKERLQLASQNIRAAVSTFLLKQQQERAREQARIDAEARDAIEAIAVETADRTRDDSVLEPDRIEQQVQQVAPRAPEPVRKAPGTTMTSHWTWELEVEGDISKVPTEWLQLNTAALTAHARSAKEQARVPGIRFSKKPGVSIR